MLDFPKVYLYYTRGYHQADEWSGFATENGIVSEPARSEGVWAYCKLK